MFSSAARLRADRWIGNGKMIRAVALRAFFIWLFLLILLLLLVGGLYRSALDRVKSDIALRQEAVIGDASQALTHYLGWVQRDAVLLGQLGRRIGALPSGGTDWRYLEGAFVDLMKTRGDVYAQIRYLDESGMEVVRVDSVGGQVAVIETDRLQNKSDRYYFQHAMQQPAGTVTVSRFDLNVERGQIEVPYNPVVRYSTRVRDVAQKERGVLVLNVRAQMLIDQIKGMAVPMGSELWLLNREGGWMIGPSAADEWRFIDPRASNARLGDTRPDLWAAIKSGTSSVTHFAEVTGGLLSASTFNPQERLRIPGIDLEAEAGMKWYLAAWLPDAGLPAYVRPLQQRSVVAVTSLATLFLVLALFWSHLMVRRRQAQEALARSEAQSRQLLEAAPDAIVVTDDVGTMVYVNEQAQRLFGYGADDMVGVKVDKLIPLRFRETHPEHVSRYSTARKGRLELRGDQGLRALRRDGLEFPVSIVLNTIDGFQGRRIIATIKDVTEIRAIQAAMMAANQQLKSINKDLESFSYSVAHDLRSPLRVLNGFTQILLTEHAAQLDEVGRDYLRRMEVASHHMGSIINGMLELSKVTRSVPVMEDLDISSLAHEVIEMLRGMDPERRVDVQIQPGMVARGDRSLIMIVLFNLLGNAWKFTSKRPEARVEVGVREHNGRSEFFVRDNGAGFDMAHAKKLFEAFERIHKGAEFPGMGIGLATVARAIEKHGGEIRAEAAVDQGATFYFSLGEEKP